MAPMLVKIAGSKTATSTSLNGFSASGTTVDVVLDLPSSGDQGITSTYAAWYRIGATQDGIAFGDGAPKNTNLGALFEEAQETLRQLKQAGHQVLAIEPDIPQAWPHGSPQDGGMGFGADITDCPFEDQRAAGGQAVGIGAAWHLGPVYSGLAAARDGVPLKDQQRVRIAHLDTGYDDAHVTKPVNLDPKLAGNFIDGQKDAIDRIPKDQWFANRGHGTATLAILAGGACKIPGKPAFNGVLGGAPGATIIPVRVADWVVRFTTGSVVQGINHAIQNGAHVLSMSLGGVPSQALADAVNAAWDAGLVMVTAAGNNYSNAPVRTVVYPARFDRVIAACGVMADGRAYTDLALGTMQGNYGPRSKMSTAIAAFTPNMPWAKLGCGDLVNMDGGGTSAATPQVAATVALWIAKHWDQLQKYPQKWMRVAAVREALFRSARKTTDRLGASETERLLGQGLLQANAALARAPLAASQLRNLAPETSSPFWILGVVMERFGATSDPELGRLLALELMQMAASSSILEAHWPDDEAPASRRLFLEAALDSGRPSRALRLRLEHHLGRQGRDILPAISQRRVARKLPPAPPPRRRLRAFALDPALAKQLDTLPINETAIELAWDDVKPGPVGDYIEVIDVDPASGKVYEPIDLNQTDVLAERGYAPSEGNPQFHQQMIYAVAMKTIATFERALGRRVLWAQPPRDKVGSQATAALAKPERDKKRKDQTVSTRRLRIYPHALRAANAYYSPDKVALLFGYFPSAGGQQQSTPRGSMVFTCLSSDIIAHEMTHAILDGMHRRFKDRSNPDVAAFHEGFADIIAIFHHFTIPELVRFEIARARGNLSVASLLGGLASQFGETTRGIGGALRDYLSEKTRARRYDATQAAHDRGEILVLAVYDAFIAIVTRRSADLIRIATNNTGILGAGALHPDLVERLTQETIKSAEHVLRMCIRALDYVPPVDITFGDYLRALITADTDLMPDDPLGYRIAFMQSFQQRGIPVRGVRTYSAETLAWNMPLRDQGVKITLPPGTWGNAKGKAVRTINWLDDIFDHVKFDLERSNSFDKINVATYENKWRVWSLLQIHFSNHPEELHEYGLIDGLARYDDEGRVRPPPASFEIAKQYTAFNITNVRPSVRTMSDGALQRTIVFSIEQRRPVFLERRNGGFHFAHEPTGSQAVSFWQRGGSTVVLDESKARRSIRYVITKSMGNTRRLRTQAEMLTGGFSSPLRETYFDQTNREPFAFLHMCHEEHDHGSGSAHDH